MAFVALAAHALDFIVIEVGLIVWRGMVGSVLVATDSRGRRLLHSNRCFSTSQAGAAGPASGKRVPPLQNAKD